MANHLSIMDHITSLGLIAAIIVSLQATPSTSACTCKFRETFGDCTIKDPSLAWKRHYTTNVGLYGDCLPTVQEK